MPNIMKKVEYYLTGIKRREWIEVDRLIEDELKFFDSKGRLRAITQYKNGKKNGRMMTFFQNGQMESDAEYKDDFQTGAYTVYYENGQVRLQATYNNGVIEGVSRTFYEDGSFWFEQNFLQGKLVDKDGKPKTGCVCNYYQNGQLSDEVNFVNGDVEGSAKHYFSNGVLSKDVEVRAGRIIRLEEYNESGEAIVHKEIGNEVVFVKEFTVNDQLVKEYGYQGGRFEGEFRSYDENGTLKCILVYKNGALNGLCKWFFQDGSLQAQIEYQNNLKNGNARWFSNDGVLIANENFIDDIKQ